MKGAYRPFGGAPFADDPPTRLGTGPLWWPLLFAPLLGTGLAWALIAYDENLLLGYWWLIELFAWPALFGFAISIVALTCGGFYRLLARIGLSLLAAGLTIPYALVAFGIWMEITCDGSCFG